MSLYCPVLQWGGKWCLHSLSSHHGIHYLSRNHCSSLLLYGQYTCWTRSVWRMKDNALLRCWVLSLQEWHFTVLVHVTLKLETNVWQFYQQGENRVYYGVTVIKSFVGSIKCVFQIGPFIYWTYCIEYMMFKLHYYAPLSFSQVQSVLHDWSLSMFTVACLNYIS